jgi:hypothetical protein
MTLGQAPTHPVTFLCKALLSEGEVDEGLRQPLPQGPLILGRNSFERVLVAKGQTRSCDCRSVG